MAMSKDPMVPGNFLGPAETKPAGRRAGAFFFAAAGLLQSMGLLSWFYGLNWLYKYGINGYSI